jgi:hypothetical protein
MFLSDKSSSLRHIGRDPYVTARLSHQDLFACAAFFPCSSPDPVLASSVHFTIWESGHERREKESGTATGAIGEN